MLQRQQVVEWVLIRGFVLFSVHRHLEDSPLPVQDYMLEPVVRSEITLC